MSFRMIHENYNVSDLDRSIKFYGDALDLHEVRRKTTDDFIIVYLGNVNFIWHLRQMILIRHIKSTKKWVVSALKILKWVFILLRIRTAIGWKFCRD